MSRHSRRLGPAPGRPRGQERGTQLVEFALLAPVLLFVLMLALDGGRMVATYTALKNGTYQAALYSAKNPSASNADLKEVIQTEGNGMLAAADIAIVSTSDQSGTNGQVMRKVTASYQFRFANPVLSRTALTMSSTGGHPKQ